jgi:hypothetical protein
MCTTGRLWTVRSSWPPVEAGIWNYWEWICGYERRNDDDCCADWYGEWWETPSATYVGVSGYVTDTVWTTSSHRRNVRLVVLMAFNRYFTVPLPPQT